MKLKSWSKIQMTSLSDLSSAIYKRSMFGFCASHCSSECLETLVLAAEAAFENSCENIICNTAKAGNFWWATLLLYSIIRSDKNHLLLGFGVVSLTNLH